MAIKGVPMRSRPNDAPLEGAELARAQQEWAAVKAALDPKLAAVGVRMVVEPQPTSRLQAPNRRGRKLTDAPPRADWMALFFEDVAPGAAEKLADKFRAAGMAEFDRLDQPVWHYEQHILECCDFAANLAKTL